MDTDSNYHSGAEPMDLDEFDAPYTSPLRGCLKLLGAALGFLAVVILTILARGILGSLFTR